MDEREAMRQAFDHFLKAKGPDRTFMGGNQPNLGFLNFKFAKIIVTLLTADLALYGACNSFFGCTLFTEMCEEDPRIGQWYLAVDKAVKEHQGKNLVAAKSRAIQRQQKARN